MHMVDTNPPAGLTKHGLMLQPIIDTNPNPNTKNSPSIQHHLPNPNYNHTLTNPMYDPHPNTDPNLHPNPKLEYYNPNPKTNLDPNPNYNLNLNPVPSPNPTHRHISSVSKATPLSLSMSPRDNFSASICRSLGPHGKVLLKHSDRFDTMSALDIMRESVTLIRADSTIHMSIMAILIFPSSIFLLSRASLHLMVMSSHLLSPISRAMGWASFLYGSPMGSLYESLSHPIVYYALAAPILFTIMLLAKASIAYSIAYTYSEKPHSLVIAITTGARAWKRAFSTCLWSSLLLFGCGSIASIIFSSIISLLHELRFSSDLILLTKLALGLFYSVIFVHIVVVGNLASTISILDERSSFIALVESFHMIKGKIQVALSLFFVSTITTSMVESLYEYRVIGIPPSNYAITTGSRMWEGPLLMFMYSFLLLLDVVMGTILYFVCRSENVQLFSPQVDSFDV